MPRCNTVRGSIAVAATLLAALLSLLPVAFLHAAPQSPAKPKKLPAKTPLKEVAVPFRAGETLNYRVSWNVFKTAANVQLSVPEQRNLFGWQSWHFRAIAHTVSPVRTLFPIDDQFDSYTDSSTLESRQFEMHLDELGKMDDQVFHFVQPGQISQAPAPSVSVLPNTRDFLGAAYALRAVDWSRTPEFRAPVYSGRDLYEMRAKRTSASEPITVAAGSFTASHVSVSIFQLGKEITAIHFEVLLANNAARTPVVIEANLPFGSVRAELISVTQ